MNKRFPHILIVEDEVVLRRAVIDYYGDQGISVTGVGTLAAARLELCKETFDAVLLDVGLPDGNGLSLLEFVSRGRALVITSTPDPELYRHLRVEHVPKPFDFTVLNRALKRILDARSERVEAFG